MSSSSSISPPPAQATTAHVPMQCPMLERSETNIHQTFTLPPQGPSTTAMPLQKANESETYFGYAQFLPSFHPLFPGPSLIENIFHTRRFVKDVNDAALLIEACVAGELQTMQDLPYGMTALPIRSGSVIVFAENSSKSLRVRWRDGALWSCSRICGPFLLYREVVCTKDAAGNPIPKAVSSVKEKKSPFTVSSVRANSRLVPCGLAKRTISLNGSDGNKYRVISYFYPQDVSSYYERSTNRQPSSLVTPSQLPLFQKYADRVQFNALPEMAPPAAASTIATPVIPSSVIPPRPSSVPSPVPPLVLLSSPRSSDVEYKESPTSSLRMAAVMRNSHHINAYHPYASANSSLLPPRKQFDRRWVEGPAILAPLVKHDI
ncbi:hypothetical protein HDU79_006186 [Rhizoclosmatium sp. JEL0117]|nr:hypothetical protein HDU79_006186 [Rhizoclosmatium sp. JEL0117]